MLSYQETCRAEWATTCGIINDLNFKFKIFAKKLEPFSVLLPTRKVSLF